MFGFIIKKLDRYLEYLPWMTYGIDKVSQIFLSTTKNRKSHWPCDPKSTNNTFDTRYCNDFSSRVRLIILGVHEISEGSREANPMLRIHGYIIRGGVRMRVKKI